MLRKLINWLKDRSFEKKEQRFLQYFESSPFRKRGVSLLEELVGELPSINKYGLYAESTYAFDYPRKKPGFNYIPFFERIYDGYCWSIDEKHYWNIECSTKKLIDKLTEPIKAIKAFSRYLLNRLEKFKEAPHLITPFDEEIDLLKNFSELPGPQQDLHQNVDWIELLDILRMSGYELSKISGTFRRKLSKISGTFRRKLSKISRTFDMLRLLFQLFNERTYKKVLELCDNGLGEAISKLPMIRKTIKKENKSSGPCTSYDYDIEYRLGPLKFLERWYFRAGPMDICFDRNVEYDGGMPCCVYVNKRLRKKRYPNEYLKEFCEDAYSYSAFLGAAEDFYRIFDFYRKKIEGKEENGTKG